MHWDKFGRKPTTLLRSAQDISFIIGYYESRKFHVRQFKFGNLNLTLQLKHQKKIRTVLGQETRFSGTMLVFVHVN